MEIARNYKIILVLSLIFLVLHGCDVAGGLDESTQFDDPLEKNAFIKGLQEHNVPYRIGNNGNVWYRISDKQKVKEVNYSIHPELKYLGTTVFFSHKNSMAADKFIEILNQHDIFYEKIENKKEIILGFRRSDFDQVRELYKEWHEAEKQAWISTQK